MRSYRSLLSEHANASNEAARELLPGWAMRITGPLLNSTARFATHLAIRASVPPTIISRNKNAFTPARSNDTPRPLKPPRTLENSCLTFSASQESLTYDAKEKQLNAWWSILFPINPNSSITRAQNFSFAAQNLCLPPTRLGSDPLGSKKYALQCHYRYEIWSCRGLHVHGYLKIYSACIKFNQQALTCKSYFDESRFCGEIIDEHCYLRNGTDLPFSYYSRSVSLPFDSWGRHIDSLSWYPVTLPLTEENCNLVSGDWCWWNEQPGDPRRCFIGCTVHEVISASSHLATGVYLCRMINPRDDENDPVGTCDDNKLVIKVWTNLPNNLFFWLFLTCIAFCRILVLVENVQYLLSEMTAMG